MRTIIRPTMNIILFVLLGAVSSGLAGQDSPFVPDRIARDLKNELSGDRAYHYVRALAPYHRIMGSQAFVDAAEMLAGLARGFGLEEVQVVKQRFEEGLSWNPRAAELWLLAPEEKLCDFDEVPVSLAVFSRSTRVEAELVDIGRGISPEDFRGIDVAGKIVLTSSPPGLAVRTAVWERGALGVVSSGGIHPESRFDTPDQVAYIKVPAAVPEGKPEPWAFNISARQYGRLQDLLRSRPAGGPPVRVRASIEAEIRKPAEQAYLWAEIGGSEIHDQDLVLTAHLDEESTSANDNGSGCASILEIGRAIRALVRQGRIAPPKRDIVFWWPNEHVSEYQLLREKPELRKGWLANVNLDMVGARQSWGSRIQHIIRTPFSLPSYLNDVVESVSEAVILGNTGFLAAEQAGTPQPFARPILASLGSRERFGAMIVPHSGGSDHEVFCEGVVGVPGIGLINNPDPYFHSSDDDLPNIDATQLERNTYIAAAVVLYLASAGDADVPLLAGEVYARGAQRLGRDLTTAMAHLAGNRAGTHAQSYREARNLVEQAAWRERKAVESVRVFAVPGGPNAALVVELANRIEKSGNELRGGLDALYLRLSGDKKLPPAGLTAEEEGLARRVPSNAGTLDSYFGKRGWNVAPPGLHPILAKECYCFVDGRRSYLDIYRAVHAEALSAGEFYYGRITPQAVRELLDAAVANGVLDLKGEASRRDDPSS